MQLLQATRAKVLLLLSKVETPVGIGAALFVRESASGQNPPKKWSQHLVRIPPSCGHELLIPSDRRLDVIVQAAAKFGANWALSTEDRTISVERRMERHPSRSLAELSARGIRRPHVDDWRHSATIGRTFGSCVLYQGAPSGRVQICFRRPLTAPNVSRRGYNRVSFAGGRAWRPELMPMR